MLRPTITIVRDPLQGAPQCPPGGRVDGPRLTDERDDTTRIATRVGGQAASRGVLQIVRDVGLPSVAARRVGPDWPELHTDVPR
jgi:hypothetical protein